MDIKLVKALENGPLFKVQFLLFHLKRKHHWQETKKRQEKKETLNRLEVEMIIFSLSEK